MGRSDGQAAELVKGHPGPEAEAGPEPEAEDAEMAIEEAEVTNGMRAAEMVASALTAAGVDALDPEQVSVPLAELVGCGCGREAFSETLHLEILAAADRGVRPDPGAVWDGTVTAPTLAGDVRRFLDDPDGYFPGDRPRRWRLTPEQCARLGLTR